MKKLTLAVGCLFLFTMGSSFARADGDAAGGLMPRLGVEGGINLASLNGPNVNDVFASRLGFVGGAFLSLPFGMAALQPELLYEQKGGKVNGNSYRMDYLEVPVLLDILLLGPLGIILGPSFAVNIDHTGVSNPNNTDIGLILGAQLDLANFLVSGRYEVGLQDVSNNQNVQNGTFTFLVGLSVI